MRQTDDAAPSPTAPTIAGDAAADRQALLDTPAGNSAIMVDLVAEMRRAEDDGQGSGHAGPAAAVAGGAARSCSTITCC